MESEPRPRPRANLLWLEFCVLFLALPWGLYLGRSATRFLVLPIILSVA